MKKIKIHCFQHEKAVSPGYLKIWAEENGCALYYTRFYEDYQFPLLDDFDVLVILGGTMNVDEHDRFPYLKGEKEFIKKAIEAKKKILGICLGAQMIARVLGSRVYPNTDKEIGWFPVTFTSEAEKDPLFCSVASLKESITFQWHGDIFDLPKGAVRIAYNPNTPNQAYVYKDKVVGVQFHPEMTEESISELIEYGNKDLKNTGIYIQTPEEITGSKYNFIPNNSILKIILENLIHI